MVFKPGPILIAAAQGDVVASDELAFNLQVTGFFNGRIDGLTLKTYNPNPSLLVKYDFSLDMSTHRIIDVSGHGRYGTLINAPIRAVTGDDWDGSDCDCTRAKFGHGAIHFHDDDMDDAGWETDFTVTIPSTARSGAYAVEVDAVNGQDNDSLVCFVRPTQWAQDNRDKI